MRYGFDLIFHKNSKRDTRHQTSRSVGVRSLVSVEWGGKLMDGSMFGATAVRENRSRIRRKPKLSSSIATAGVTLVTLLFCAIALASSASADPDGSSAAVVDGVLTFTAGAAQDNNVLVRHVGTSLRVADSLASITAGAGCTAFSASEVTCPADGINAVALLGGDGSERLRANTSLPTAIDGGSGSDVLIGGSGADLIDGGEGNDVLIGNAGGDTLNGGDGSDTASYSERTAPVSLSLDSQPNDGETGEGDAINDDVERLIGGAGNDTLTGNDQNNVLIGNAGDDTLNGGDGNDTLKSPRRRRHAKWRRRLRHRQLLLAHRASFAFARLAAKRRRNR